MRSPNKKLVKKIYLQVYYTVQLSEPLPWIKAPRAGIVRFLVSLPLAWERQGRKQYGSQLKISLASIQQGRDQLIEPLPWVKAPRSGIVRFLVSLPLVWERQGREQYGSQLNIPLAFIRQGQEKQSGPLPCLCMARSRTVWSPVKYLPCPYAAKSRPVKWASPLSL